MMISRHTLFCFLATVCAVTVISFGCTRPEEQPTETPEEQDLPENPADMKALKASIVITDNWVFDKRPKITFHIDNPNDFDVRADLTVKLTTDTKSSAGTAERSVALSANGKNNFVVSTSEDMAPGIYQAACSVNGKSVRKFFFALNPFEIVSAPDKQPDFDNFWAVAKDQLAAVDMNAELTEIASKSNAYYKTYLVEMYSFPDGTSGDPVLIHGYYIEPQDGQKHPVIIHFYGYDTQKNPPHLYCPSGSAQYAEFYLSHRGQYINNRTAGNRDYDGKGDFANIYGDWFAYNFGNKDGYYYRGAFMDCVQAVRFMATRPTSDMNNLFAEGSSQGGALCYAAAALSDIPFSGIAANVAFLGDYPDYFKIVTWPGDTAKKNKGSMSDEQMYAFLSYFDTKNLATMISCPVWATSGLQDGTCPPHTNLAPFNNLKSTDKTMNFYPEMTHDYPKSWSSDISKFFKEHTK